MSGPENKFDPNKYHAEIEKVDKLFVDIGLEAVTSCNVIIEPVDERPHPTMSLDELEALLVDVGASTHPYIAPQRAERNLVQNWFPGAFLQRPK